MQKHKLDKIIETTFGQISQGLENYVPELEPKEIGVVLSIASGIVRVSGLPGVGYEELLKFPNNILGIAFNIDETEIGVILLGDDTKLTVGDKVERTGRVMDVPVGDELIGRVVNPLGEPLDGKEIISLTHRLPVEREAPAIMDRGPVATPLQTGLKVIDVFTVLNKDGRSGGEAYVQFESADDLDQAKQRHKNPMGNSKRYIEVYKVIILSLYIVVIFINVIGVD